MSEHDHTQVAPTAWGVAYLRSLTDIPYAKEFYEALSANLSKDLAKGGMRDHLAPQLEARYKLLDELISKTGIRQVVELAAGVSTRGLNMSNTNPDLLYTQTDLPDVMQHQSEVLESLSIVKPSNLHLRDADALEEAQIRSAITDFDTSKPIVITHEGLMRYLTFPEKAKLARIVKSILEDYGGYWITPDISMRTALSRENERAKNHTEGLKQTTGIDIEKNVFESSDHARSFFEDLGFSIEQHSFLEVSDELVSPERLGMTDGDAKRLNEPCIAFVMQLSDKPGA